MCSAVGPIARRAIAVAPTDYITMQYKRSRSNLKTIATSCACRVIYGIVAILFRHRSRDYGNEYRIDYRSWECVWFRNSPPIEEER